MLASQMLDNVALAPLILTILAACYYPAVPRGYQHISDDQHSLQALARLTTVSQIFSFILFVLASASFNLARFYYPVAFGALTWAGLIALAPRLHSVSNIKLASHLTMFLILALNLIATVYVSKDLVMRYRDFDFEKLKYDLAACILLSQFAITLVFTFWVGFWSPGDDTAIEENRSRESTASVLSGLTFSWLNELVDLGNSKVLEQGDIWKLIDGDSSSILVEEFVEKRQSNPDWSLKWTIFRIVSPLIAYQWSCSILTSILSFAGPFFLYNIITTVSNTQGSERLGAIWYLLGLFCSTSVKAVIDGQMYFTGRRIGTRSRAILVGLLYNKSLRRSMCAPSSSDDENGHASLGKIVTLMSVDTERIRAFLSYSQDCFVSQPLSIVVALVSLFFVLGWSALAGVIMILAIGPIGSYLGNMISVVQEDMMSFTDERVSIMNEILQGIRIVKYFGWEEHFKKKVDSVRQNEMKSIFKLWSLYIGFGNIAVGGGILVAFTTFAFYTLVFKNTLDAATAFTAINLLRVVSDLMSYLPHQIMEIYKAKVALSRINEFLDESELEPKSQLRATGGDSDSFAETVNDVVVGFVQADFGYGATDAAVIPAKNQQIEDISEVSSHSGFTLRNLDVSFPIGKLIVVSGPTGSGKSSLLLALLGEMNRIAGAVYLPDSASPLSKNSDLTNAVAYVAQTAWLTNATIRENIIFGEEFDSARYERVIKDCALVKDFQTLAGGDLTEIGEKGINLSGTIIYNAGGQKQRISLARACYSRAGFVLLDDPLSAVDAPTAKYLLQQCILGCLRGRTCILVSHAVALVVPYADYCIVVKNGEIACQGSPESIVANPEADGLFGLSLQAELLEEQEDLTNKHPVAAGLGTGTALVQAEEKADGSVRWDIYKNYFLASGGILFIVLFISSFFIVSMAKVGNDWWLKHWTDSANLPLAFNHTEAIANPVSNYGTNSEYVKSRVNNFMQNSVLKDAYPAIDDQGSNALFYVGIYAIFGVSVMLANNLQIGIVLGGSWIGSRNIHRKLLDSILGAPLRFFETTPIGRVLNRFSKDIENVDMMVMESVEYFISRIISGATIVAVIGSVVPPFLIAIPPIIFLYKQIAQKYLKTSRELKRIESVTRSPIYAQFSETLSGVATIRAYGVQKRFSDNIRNMVDANHQSFFYIWAANRWLCLRTDILSGLVVFFSGIAVIVSGVEPGWAALTITYALDFTNVLLWTVRTHAEMEMAMNSVERIEEYMAIEQEPPAIIEGRRPDANWPANGAVKVDGLSIRYAPDQADVLRNVSFEILAHEKLAVVGRTGAGKSTLSLAFFRILPLSGGSITIDGIDINDIGLLDLRSRLTVIPQDPVLFTGTVRTNLDPLEERTDQELWDALDRAHLSDSLQKSNIDNDLLDPAAFTLDYAVTENGANFSQGQRQLLCLARALLRGSRIVFLDEATASVDNETDMKIQKTIRQEFKSSTVVCIAHRLRTVIDYDKILVLDKGRVVEFGAPSDLINTKQGAFRAMCEETGEFEELVQLASAGKFQ